MTLRRDRSRRRLPRRPAAGQGACAEPAPGDHRPARPHGRALQPHARGPARLPPLRRHALHRTAFAGATTGQQLLYALDEQVRRWEAEGQVTQVRVLGLPRPIVDDEGVCRGIVAQDLRTMQIRAFPADAVVLATGGNGIDLRPLDQRR